jgi:hypothetical protein
MPLKEYIIPTQKDEVGLEWQLPDPVFGMPAIQIIKNNAKEILSRALD